MLLRFASLCGHRRSVEVLLENGADLGLKDRWGRSVLYYNIRSRWRQAGVDFWLPFAEFEPVLGGDLTRACARVHLARLAAVKQVLQGDDFHDDLLELLVEFIAPEQKLQQWATVS